LTIKMDPRVKSSTSALIEQHDYSMMCYHDKQKALYLLKTIGSLQAQVKVLPSKIGEGNHDSLRNEIDTCYFKLGMINHLLTASIPEGRISLNDELQQLFGMVEGVDIQPTTQCLAEANAANTRFEKLWHNWELLQKELKTLNTMLKAEKLTEVKWE
jgi:hypothetical protein